MTKTTHFCDAFEALTGNRPFPWQEELYQKFMAGKIPSACSLPTGLGKTSIIAVWLLALAGGTGLPRRVVYVVNRRTVVDQTTAEVERLRENLPKLKLPGFDTLAISTLRGQFADNREWSANPSRPAVIIGTVDMIGSRLLFSGYGIGFKSRPLHAGFLGQDALIVHDEAHLEPAFQKLIDTIRDEQRRCQDFASCHVVELTATTRGGNHSIATPFTLTPADQRHPVVKQRFEANKQLVLVQIENDKQTADKIAELALRHKDDGVAVLVFVRILDDVNKVCDRLTQKKGGVPAVQVQQLTGTMRGMERDCMTNPRRSDSSRVFARFLRPPKPDAPESERWKIEPMPGTVYLVCTSAGEVGVDISADHMVCDLSTFESMAQRFGRVNRYGDRPATLINVVHPAKFDDKDKLTSARNATLELLQQLNGDASPKALGDLMALLTIEQRKAAFAPEPTIPSATDILFDAWALTSIRKPMPGRPPVEPYLHGIAEWQPPETRIAWREEVEIITSDLLEQHPAADLIDDYPIMPHELLRDRSDRVLDQLQQLAGRHPKAPVWLIDAQGEISTSQLAKLADPSATKASAKKPLLGRIEHCTIMLPPVVGGLKRGMLDVSSDQACDVADAAIDERGRARRQRIWDNETVPGHLRVVRTIDIRPNDDEEGNAPRKLWHWGISAREGGRTANKPVAWDKHVGNVVDQAKRIVAGLSLPQEIADTVILAARLHDHGKRRERFQLTLGNREFPRVILAKSNWRAAARLPEPFRHEFASVLDAYINAEFGKLSTEMQDLLLHIIAAHHGRARPHFNPDEAFDPERPTSDAEMLTIETPRRFARLQRKYGRWGLAYLESLLRAADWAASAAETEVLS